MDEIDYNRPPAKEGKIVRTKFFRRGRRKPLEFDFSDYIDEIGEDEIDYVSPNRSFKEKSHTTHGGKGKLVDEDSPLDR